MTRETKIGLLVGLAFVIVIGILLSDHITRSMQPPQAALMETAPNVLGSSIAPGANRAGTSSDVRVGEVQPDRLVRTSVDRVTGRADVSVGPGPSRSVDVTSRVGGSDDPVQGNVLGNPPAGGNRDVTVPENPTEPPASREYVAERGDTLGRIARKALGSDTLANREALVKANPALQKDPHKIIAGRKYIIPLPQTSTGHDDSVLAHGPASAPPVTDVVYTTKPGDSLWKIAMEQVGSGSAVAQIRELNKDVLKNGDRINPSMKLKLPAKQVASAN